MIKLWNCLVKSSILRARHHKALLLLLGVGALLVAVLTFVVTSGQLFVSCSQKSDAELESQRLKVLEKALDRIPHFAAPNNLPVIPENLLNRLDKLEKETKALSQAQSGVEPKIWAKLGLVAVGVADFAKAEADFELALEGAKKRANILEQAENLSMLGMVSMMRGQPEKAKDLFEKSLTLSSQLCDYHLLNVNYGNIGLLNAIQFNYDVAMGYSQISLKYARQSQDSGDLATSLINLGDLYRRTGRRKEAVHNFREAMNIGESMEDPKIIASAYRHIGLTLKDSGDIKNALDNLQKALELDRQIGDKVEEAGDLANIGIAYRRAKDKSSAQEYLVNAWNILDKYDIKYYYRDVIMIHLQQLRDGESD